MARFRPMESAEQRKAWGLLPADFAFGVVGGYSLPRGKGQPEFLQAAAKIRNEVPRARFLIIGRGDMRASLESQIDQLALRGVAQLTPWCTDMAAGMNALDCLVLPQVGTEAIPGVVSEAHACGKPVIASDLDGIPEAFAAANYGKLVRRESIEELAAAMVEWAAKPRLPLDQQMQMHTRVAELFSLERAAKDLSALYESLSGRKSMSPI
jgi:glycosyltransferase involved in cell wall biosynthesis